MLNVQGYLQSGKSLDDLSEEFGVRSKKYENGLVVLNYDQINSPKNDPITNECRGLILNWKKNYCLVSRKFDRFFNLGECDNIPDSWDGWIIEEKADGSIIGIYKFESHWEISTRGMAFAEATMSFSNLENPNFTFREGVLEALGMNEEQFQSFCEDQLDPSVTYIFEYISPKNRVVTPYLNDALVLLGAEEIISAGVSFSYSTKSLDNLCDRLNLIVKSIRRPVKYSATNTIEIEEAVAALPDLQEGFVCLNPQTGQRIKVKAKAYLTAHRIKGNGTPTLNDVAELVVLNEYSEFLSYFPEFQFLFDPVIEKYAKLTNETETIYTEIKDIESQKEFAIKAKDCKMSAILFTARGKKMSVRDAISDAKPSYLVKVLIE